MKRFGRRLREIIPNGQFSDEPAAFRTKEAAEALARRATLGALGFPAMALASFLAIPEDTRRPPFLLVLGLFNLVVAAMRLAVILPFDRRYVRDPVRWWRDFRAGADAAAVVWVVFALASANFSGSGWPAWLILSMTVAIGVDAAAFLYVEPQLAMRFQLLLLGPFLFWGLVRGGAGSHACGLAASASLAILVAQTHRNARQYRQAALDRQARREAAVRRDALADSVNGIVWEADAQRKLFTFIGARAEAIPGYAAQRWLDEPSFWEDHVHPDDRDRVTRGIESPACTVETYTLEYRMLTADGHTVWLRDVVFAKAAP
jgi:PAS domain-containing protein